MSGLVGPQEARPVRASRPAILLAAGAMLLLTAAGVLMWSRHGGKVFGDLVLTALAWCF